MTSPSRHHAYADTVPLATPRTTLASSHRPKGSDFLNTTFVPQPIGVGSIDVEIPAGSSPCSRTYSGMPWAHVVAAMRSLRSLRMRSRSSSTPMVSSSHFMRARSLLSRLP